MGLKRTDEFRQDAVRIALTRGPPGSPVSTPSRERRSKLSEIQISEIPREQNRCIWFDAYEAVLGPLEPIPTEYHYARLVMPEPTLEAEIRRAVSNAIQRVNVRLDAEIIQQSLNIITRAIPAHETAQSASGYVADSIRSWFAPPR